MPIARMITIKDIAAAIGRSTATVDRVLNNRPGVRDATRRAVLEAAEQLHYPRALRPRRGFDMVLPNAGGFVAALADHARPSGADASAPWTVRVHTCDYADPVGIAKLLRGLAESSAGVALVAVDHIDIRNALRTLIDRSVPVVTMLTDISSLPHQGYVGVDNRVAGRLAGYLIGRFLGDAPANVVVFTGSRAFRGHDEREMGFRSVVREHFPYLAIREVLEIGEDPEAGFAATTRLLDGEAVAAIYNIGAGSAGIARALQAVPRTRKPVFVAHDLSVDTRTYLAAGTIDAVIDQNAAAIVERTIARLIAARGTRLLGVSEMMESRIVLMENIPLDQ